MEVTTLNPKSVKAKGRLLQNLVRDKLRVAHNLCLVDDDIKSQTMGMTGEDIVLSPKARKYIPYSFECKNQERIQLWKAIEQAEANKKDDSNIAVVIKRNRTKPYVVIDLDHFVDLIVGDGLKEEASLNGDII
tara:strand:+ start:1884 stop:2282 length:399 start_codon:yes stop_codon:yes gene_type:complete